MLRRLSWSVLKRHQAWRELPLREAQVIIDAGVSAYIKGMMMFATGDFDRNPDYGKEFEFPAEVWDVLSGFTAAKKWNDIPFHDPHPVEVCNVCRKFDR